MRDHANGHSVRLDGVTLCTLFSPKLSTSSDVASGAHVTLVVAGEFSLGDIP